MDNSKVEIRDKNKFGKGLFAKEDIEKGELIADWTGGKIYTAKKATDLPNDPPDFIQTHAIQFADDKYIDYTGIGRYFNHSCVPNCGFKGKFKVVSMIKISKGEELTMDYEMVEDSDWRMECLCGSKNCRKIIGAFSNLPESTRRKYNGYISSWLKKKYKLRI